DNGKTLWSYVFKDTNSDPVPPLADGGHVFFISQMHQQAAKILEFDENSGTLLWQRQLNGMESITAFHLENHYLLIETNHAGPPNQTDTLPHKLYVLRDSDKSPIWSNTP